jgi:hypothetical protein
MIWRRGASRGGATPDSWPDDPEGAEPDSGDTAEPDIGDNGDTAEPDIGDTGPTSDRPARSPLRWLSPRSQREDPASEPAVPADDLDLNPSDMRSPEPLYGYVVAMELIAVSILNLTLTHGKGAPTHPSTTLSLIGLIASLAVLGIVRTHHRLIVGFAAVIAAFFVTLPKVPDSLSTTHLLALIIPVIYAFVLTQRQRKAATARQRAGRSASSRPAPAASTATSGSGGRRGRKKASVPTGPTANRRYTPPKAKRPSR